MSGNATGDTAESLPQTAGHVSGLSGLSAVVTYPATLFQALFSARCVVLVLALPSGGTSRHHGFAYIPEIACLFDCLTATRASLSDHLRACRRTFVLPDERYNNGKYERPTVDGTEGDQNVSVV